MFGKRRSTLDNLEISKSFSSPPSSIRSGIRIILTWEGDPLEFQFPVSSRNLTESTVISFSENGVEWTEIHVILFFIQGRFKFTILKIMRKYFHKKIYKRMESSENLPVYYSIFRMWNFFRGWKNSEKFTL